MVKYLIEFDFSPDDDGPRSIVWAGPTDDGPGFAPQKETAYEFLTTEGAQAFMEAAYGGLSDIGSIVGVETPG